MAGDSLGRQHFFAVGCDLGRHVKWRMDEEPEEDVKLRSQHLFLNPESPLLRQLRLPAGFNIQTTPLVTFMRVDLLFSKAEMLQILERENSGKSVSLDMAAYPGLLCRGAFFVAAKTADLFL